MFPLEWDWIKQRRQSLIIRRHDLSESFESLGSLPTGSGLFGGISNRDVQIPVYSQFRVRRNRLDSVADVCAQLSR
jgi:hypothetical protein